MAKQYPTAREALTVRSHRIALPYRGDGVACALHQTYQADQDDLPLEMIQLLAAIGDRRIVSGRG